MIRRSIGGRKASIAGVTTRKDGTYTFTDTPVIAGRYGYLALWSGEATVGPAKATHQIMVE
ncbi:hypothetical protein GCM10018953_31500 [Streptosporangium nondiastaticum]